jgi:hypothetical protein
MDDLVAILGYTVGFLVWTIGMAGFVSWLGLKLGARPWPALLTGQGLVVGLLLLAFGPDPLALLAWVVAVAVALAVLRPYVTREWEARRVKGAG